MPISEAVLAAAVPAAISAVSNMASSAANRYSNAKLANKQLDANYALWKEQNAYNTPSAQAQRLKNAGLNPALAYGGSSQVVGNADPTPQLDYSGAINTPLFDTNSSIQLGMSAAQLSKQLQVMDSTVEMQNANALKLRADAATADAMRDPSVQEMMSRNELNLAKKSEAYQSAEVLRNQADYVLKQGNLTDQEAEGYRLANIYASRTMEFRVAAADLNNQEARSRIKVNNALASKYGAEIDQILANCKVLDAQVGNVKADTALKDENARVAKQNVRTLAASEKQLKALEGKILKETEYTSKQVQWFVADHISSYIGTASSSAGSIMKGVSSLMMVP